MYHRHIVGTEIALVLWRGCAQYRKKIYVEFIVRSTYVDVDGSVETLIARYTRLFCGRILAILANHRRKITIPPTIPKSICITY